MLWQKESNKKNALYVDLFQSEHRELYLINRTEKMMFDVLGTYYKNDSTAEDYRQIGNKMFGKKQFTDAMEYYNKSMCFAQEGSSKLGLAYANRSTCFLELKMFKKCLADIELAKQNKYPVCQMLKLNKRKTKCLELMEREEDRGETGEPKLDFAANEKFPCLANVLDIRSNDVFGHHIVATADIGVNKTILVEQCYIGVTKNDHYKACNICLKEDQNLIPCKKCTSALFCTDCKENDLHAIECNMNFGCPAGFKFMDVVRTISMAKKAFATADELIAFVEDLLKKQANWRNCEFQPTHLVDPQSKYRAFFTMIPEWQKHVLYLPEAFQFYQLLLDQNDMNAFFCKTTHKRFLQHLVQHHILLILQQAYNKRTKPMDGVNITDTYVNIIAKNVHHLCIPNVCHVMKNGRIVGVVIRPIKKNEQIFTSRLLWDIFESEPHRRAVLQSRFIDCKCEWCEVGLLPSNDRMLSDSNFRLIKIMFNMEKLSSGMYDCDEIDDMKKWCFVFLWKYGRMKWSREMIHIIRVLSFLLIE